MKNIKDFEDKLNSLVEEFEEFKSSQSNGIKLKAGQHWQHEDGSVYVLSTIIEERDLSKYALIDIEDGVCWHYPNLDIEEVFEKAREYFVLIKNV
jgi:hypothetical protein